MKTVGLIVASKSLLPYKNSTIIENSIHILKKAEVDLIVLVIGSNEKPTESLLKNKKLVIAHNDDTTNNIMSYVRVGLKKILNIQYVEQRDEIPYEALFIQLGDAPSLTPSILVREQLFMKYCDAKILFPTIQGKKKYPPLIRFNVLQEICDYNGEDGLEGALAQFEDETLYMEVDD